MRTLIKDYTVSFKNYGEITIPKGTKTTNQTACGIDKNYNFVNEYNWINELYPTISAILKHDVIYYGVNVPNEYLTAE